MLITSHQAYILQEVVYTTCYTTAQYFSHHLSQALYTVCICELLQVTFHCHGDGALMCMSLPC